MMQSAAVTGKIKTHDVILVDHKYLDNLNVTPILQGLSAYYPLSHNSGQEDSRILQSQTIFADHLILIETPLSVLNCVVLA